MADPKKTPQAKKDDNGLAGKIVTGGLLAGGGSLLTNALVQDAKNRGVGRNILNEKFNESLTSQVKAKPTSITTTRVKPATQTPVKPQQVGPTPASGVNPKGGQQQANTAPKSSPVPSSGQRFDPIAERRNMGRPVISNASFDNSALDASNKRNVALTGRDLSGNRVPLSSPERAAARTATSAQDRAQLPELEAKARSRVAARQRAVISSVQRSVQPINNTLQSLGASGFKLSLPTSQIKEQTDKAMKDAGQRTNASDKPLTPRQTERAAANFAKEAGTVPKSKVGQMASNVKDVTRAIGGIKLGESKWNLGKASKVGGVALTATGVAMPYINQGIGKIRYALANKDKPASPDGKPAKPADGAEKPSNPVDDSAFTSAMNDTIKSANKNAPRGISSEEYHQWIVDRVTEDYGNDYGKRAAEELKKQGKK